MQKFVINRLGLTFYDLDVGSTNVGHVLAFEDTTQHPHLMRLDAWNGIIINNPRSYEWKSW